MLHGVVLQRFVTDGRRPVIFILHFVDFSTLPGTITDGETGNHNNPQFNCAETHSAAYWCLSMISKNRKYI